MKNLIIIILLLSLSSTQAQNVNDYKYVIVPQKFADFEKNATAYQIKKGIVTSKNKMNVKLARSGGFALSLIEATPENMEGVKKWK